MVNNLGAFAETLCSVGAFNSVKYNLQSLCLNKYDNIW